MTTLVLRNRAPMLNLHAILSDVGTAVGAATGIAALLRIDELAILFRSHASLTSELLKVRAERNDLLGKVTAQHTGMVAIEDAFRGLEQKVDGMVQELGTVRLEHDGMAKRLAKLEPMFDGAVAYIHALTAWGLRLLRALKANQIHVGIDENLPKPPDVLLEYVPEQHRPPE